MAASISSSKLAVADGSKGLRLSKKMPSVEPTECAVEEVPGEGRYTAAQLAIVMPDDDNLGTMTDDIDESTSDSSECYHRRGLSLVQSPLTPGTPINTFESKA
eukprot:TRINITY_DN38697_c0_g1_i1.p1 TRINITY_DN38697_c0_g1~~TRINITY_DN38697_c0_g1_i1.p1  ORF type:complete len:103 (+),score=23.05 TRINITY_DN38697_c0_g1_i1:59-367(+)